LEDIVLDMLLLVLFVLPPLFLVESVMIDF
jgi:hypothetical protein